MNFILFRQGTQKQSMVLFSLNYIQPKLMELVLYVERDTYQCGVYLISPTVYFPLLRLTYCP